MRSSILTPVAAALALAACGQKTEPATPDPEPAPAVTPAPTATSGPAASPSARTDSVPSAGDTGVMQPSDPPPTLPEDKTGMSPSTGSPPPQP
ncbi:MAG TPA: hypothetical protein VGE54_10425 [Brevundimonas sp.]